MFSAQGCAPSRSILSRRAVRSAPISGSESDTRAPRGGVSKRQVIAPNPLLMNEIGRADQFPCVDQRHSVLMQRLMILCNREAIPKPAGVLHAVRTVETA